MHMQLQYASQHAYACYNMHVNMHIHVTICISTCICSYNMHVNMHNYTCHNYACQQVNLEGGGEYQLAAAAYSLEFVKTAANNIIDEVRTT